MDEDRRQEILKRGRLSSTWEGEPMLGGWYTEAEIEATVRAMRDSMDPLVGFGFFCDEIVDFEHAFAEYCGTQHAVSVTSAGAGLDMAMMALDLEPGDEIISPATNFKAAHHAILGQGAKLVLCEVDPRTLCADPADVAKRITPRTRAILATHMNGLSAPMDDYLEIAQDYPHSEHGPLEVIGDAARACGGGYKGTKIGKKGWMTIFSFHTMKLMTTLGEGGMITTDDPELACRLRGIRMWGDDTGRWGGNYKLTKIQAAVGLVQLRRLDEMLAPRVRLARQRTALLDDIIELTLPYEPPECQHTYYLYTILVPREWAGEKRGRLLRMLQDDYNVGTTVANPPTYQGDAFIRQHTAGQDLPLANELGARLFCPPLHPRMAEADNEFIAAAISEAVARIAAE